LHSGYDFGYLVRLLTNCKLPDKEKDFFELLSIFFPKLYDVKYLMKSCKSLKGGLQEVADSLEVGPDWLALALSVMVVLPHVSVCVDCSWRGRAPNTRQAVIAT
jgi:hypothetical protein